jgi:hypothetical protein
MAPNVVEWLSPFLPVPKHGSGAMLLVAMLSFFSLF